MKKIVCIIIILVVSMSIVSCSINKVNSNKEETIVLEDDVKNNKNPYKVSIEKLELENKGFRAFQFNDEVVYGLSDPTNMTFGKFTPDNNTYELLENSNIIKGKGYLNRERSESPSYRNPTYNFYNEGMRNLLTGEDTKLVSIEDRIYDFNFSEGEKNRFLETLDKSYTGPMTCHDDFVGGSEKYILLKTNDVERQRYQLIIYDLESNSIYKSDIMDEQSNGVNYVTGTFYSKQEDSIFRVKGSGEILKLTIKEDKVLISDYSKVKLDKNIKINNVIITNDKNIYFETWIEDGKSNPLYLKQIIDYDIVKKKGNKIYDINKGKYFITYVSKKFGYLVTTDKDNNSNLYKIENGELVLISELPSGDKASDLQNVVVPNEDGGKLFITTYNRDDITGEEETLYSIYSVHKN